MKEEEQDIREANLLIAGGGGIGSRENFELLKTVADLASGMVAGSRVAVEKGWIDYSLQVGQTGKVVQPRLYIACGISGAVQHLVGIKGVQTVIAINTDPKAPIFEASDYGFIEDYKVILKALEKLLKEDDDRNNLS